MDAAERSIPRDLFELLRGFSSLAPPSRLCFPANISPALVQDFLINFILLNSHIRDYPPSREYQKNFWKWVITHLESIEEFEIDSRIYDYYVELMPHSGPALGPPQPHMFGQICDLGLPLRAPPSPSYVTHFWNLERDPHMTQESESVDMAQLKTTTLFESRTTIESGTTGLRTWRAGFLLAQYLILRPELVQGKRVLELGSGAGFLGITVASLQTFSALNSSLWMTDVNGTVLQRCRENIGLPCNLSSAHPRVQCVHLDWAISLDPELSPQLQSWLDGDIDADVILGADIVFDPSLIPALIGVLCLALRSSTMESPKFALIALTVRNGVTMSLFLTAVQDVLLVEELEANAPTFLETVETDTQTDIKILKMTLLP